MSSVRWHAAMSVDGLIASPDDEMDWAFAAGGSSSIADEVREQLGAIVAGRRWYDVATEKYGGTGGIYGGAWAGPVLVLTHRDTPDDPTVAFVSDGIRSSIATAQDAAGDKSVGLLGANTVQQAFEAGLVDEIVIHVAPVLLGDGIRFYGGPGVGRVELEPSAVAESGQVVDLRYRVVK
jgi:dihydrofolate reductase